VRAGSEERWGSVSATGRRKYSKNEASALIPPGRDPRSCEFSPSLNGRRAQAVALANTLCNQFGPEKPGHHPGASHARKTIHLRRVRSRWEDPFLADNEIVALAHLPVEMY